jgi:hypothetical protein
LSFSCVAVIKPKEKTAKYLVSTDQDSLLDLFSSNGFEDRALLCEQGHKAGNCELGSFQCTLICILFLLFSCSLDVFGW